MSAHSQRPGVPPTDRRALSFLHQARPVRDLDSHQVERIARRLHKPIVRARRPMLWPALAVMTLFMVAGAAIAVAQGGLRALPLVGPLVSSIFRAEPKPGPVVEPHRRRATPTSTGAPNPEHPTESAVPGPTPASETPQRAPGEASSQIEPTGKAVAPLPREAARTIALREPALHRKSDDRQTSPMPEQEPSPAQPEDPIVAESRSFAAVIEAWHRRHDLASALALLDLHERRYLTGHMRLETHILRAELYLAQSRGRDALAVLDGLSLSGLPRERELQTVRGELRVNAGRCAEARTDLTAVLEKNLIDALAKRASQALSRCP